MFDVNLFEDTISFDHWKDVETILILGDEGVGKSTFLKTIHHHFTSHLLNINLETPYLTFYQGETLYLIKDYNHSNGVSKQIIYSGVSSAILLFDLSTRNSFRNLEKWLVKIIRHSNKFVPVVIAGNKAELIDDRKITTEEVMKLTYTLGNASSCKIPYVEISALNGNNCKFLINIIQKMIACPKKFRCMDIPAYERIKCEINHFTPIILSAS